MRKAGHEGPARRRPHRARSPLRRAGLRHRHRAEGAAMVTGGAALALGIVPRAAATGLVASLLPTTVAGHPFWETADPAVREVRKIQFLKNVGLIGALLLYLAGDDH